MTELTDNTPKFNEDEAIRRLNQEVSLHQTYLNKESVLSNIVSTAWGGDKESLDKLTQLQKDIAAARAKGDRAEVTRLAQEADKAAREDRETLQSHEKYAGYATGAIKAAGLFARGPLAATLCVGSYGLDQMRMGQDAKTNFQDGVLGGIKGYAMQRLFEKVAHSPADPFTKGVGLGFTSQLVDNLTNRDNYKGSDIGSLASGFGRSLTKSVDLKTLAVDGVVFAGGASMFKATEAITGKTISPLYRTMMAGGSFGMVSGAAHEVQRQNETPGETFDLGKIIKSSLIQGGVDSIAAMPGGFQARAEASGAGSKSSIAKIQADSIRLDQQAIAREYQARFGTAQPFADATGDPAIRASRKMMVETGTETRAEADAPKVKAPTASDILAKQRPDFLDILQEAPRFAKMKAVRWLGEGNESAVIEVAPNKLAPEGAALKVTLPEGGWQYEWGRRPFDAKMIGEMQEVDANGVSGNVYLQELVETRDSYEPEDVNRFMRKIEEAGLEFSDPGADPTKQLGFSKLTGELVLIDYAAVDKKGANETHQAIIGGAERVEAEYEAENEARRNGKDQREDTRDDMGEFDIDVELRREQALQDQTDKGKRAMLKGLFMGESIDDVAITKCAETGDWSDKGMKDAKTEAKQLRDWAIKQRLLDRH